MSKATLSFLVLTFTALVTACSGFVKNEYRSGTSSSLVDFLYPGNEVPTIEQDQTPHLKLPLRVGLAFVPAKYSNRDTLPENKKTQLLEQVKSEFSHLPYVNEITVIPEAYMRSRKGFDGLEQLSRLYSLDVIALVSFDQVAISSGRKSALLYWTIVGSYVVKGSQNSVNTFVDTAVIDMKTRKLLLRAPGVSELAKNSTLVELDKVSREIKEEGFEMAMVDMSQNLTQELQAFEERIKQDKSVEVSYRKGHGGGGSVSLMTLLALALLLALCRRSANLP
ncbi:rhombotarget lipoprotein [Gilvimarinus algae]|uniref:Rhombotarget lipoprotein n=1 Tax=Gilvimarinus algae TaxID=3058037 RepID=A0ABT8TDV0_9GAMM|nr:rhombotarget lipoprotein [Gilvimarinus sp. SDUM040014]MDO3381298.1 rhombotarget lipoprotein [Gilvimarinus sp. SDUM040014]